MDMWNLVDLDAPAGTRDPIVLHSGDGARAVMIKLDAGQALGDHEVKERAWDDEQRCGVGTLLTFAPGERHSLVADGGARILLLLAPWPGEGHYRGEEMAL